VLLLAAACSRPLSHVDAGGNGQLPGAGSSGGAAGAAGTPGGTGTAGGGGIGVGGGAGNAAGGAAGAAGAAATGGQGGGFRTQCTDGVDNDGDGSIDYDDPECLSGGDNDESTFAYGFLHETDTTCTQDCFFDGNSGMGDDGCRWQPKCDPASVVPGCPHDPLYAMEHVDACSLSASQSQRCVDTCGKLVPNGCDCFGCCVVPGLTTPVRLLTTCTAADFGNPARCPPCTQVTQCSNPCDQCEFCIGKRALPDGCVRPDGSAPYTCPTGSIACGATGVAPWACPAGTSCVTGCCLQQYPVP
jgi:hypothetical protein